MARIDSALEKLARIPTWSLLLVAWLAVYASRPGTLGFYEDDWQVIVPAAQNTAPFTWDRLSYHMEIYGNRPGAGLLAFGLSSVCQASPVRWQVALGLAWLAVAFALRAMFRAILRLSAPDQLWAADAAAALWLVFPWALGFTAWPTMASGFASPLFFALAAHALFSEWADGRSRSLRASLFFLFSILTYEMFYFQFVPLFLAGWWLGAVRTGGGRRFARSLGLWVGAQVLAVAWNRAAPLFISVAGSEPLRLSEWTTQILHLPKRLPALFQRGSPLPEIMLALLPLALCAAAILLQSYLFKQRPVARKQAGLLALCGLGILIGLLVLAVAGYSIAWVGQGSRRTLCFSVWFAAALAIALSSVGSRPGKWRLAAATLSVALGILMVAVTHTRLRAWSEVWDIQQNTIATAPVQHFRSATPGAVVLLTGSHRHNGVTTFSGRYGLDGIMKCNFPEVVKRRLRFLPARDDYITTWDGQVLLQRRAMDGRRMCRLKADEVWVWERGESTAFRAAAPFEHPSPSEDVRVTDRRRGTAAGAGL